MDRPDYWEAAIRRRNREAEEKFAKGIEVDEDDMVVMALTHPKKFDILIQTKR